MAFLCCSFSFLFHSFLFLSCLSFLTLCFFIFSVLSNVPPQVELIPLWLQFSAQHIKLRLYVNVGQSLPSRFTWPHCCQLLGLGSPPGGRRESWPTMIRQSWRKESAVCCWPLTHWAWVVGGGEWTSSRFPVPVSCPSRAFYLESNLPDTHRGSRFPRTGHSFNFLLWRWVQVPRDLSFV